MSKYINTIFSPKVYRPPRSIQYSIWISSCLYPSGLYPYHISPHLSKMHASLLLALLPSAFAAPLIKPRGATLIENKWIVKFKSEVSIASVSEAKLNIASTPDFEYSLDGFTGFAGTLTDEEVAQLQASDSVEYIQQDAEVHTQAYQTQAGATWGLSRLAHKSRSDVSKGYKFDSTAGEGTCSYIIDTGIYTAHSDFEGRAEFLENFTGDGSNSDGNGHGTHVAGTVGSKTYGVAKKTKLYAVKVLDSSGSGTFSGVIAGIQYAAQHASSNSACTKGSVANMSLGGSKTQSVNDAVAAAVRTGLFFAVAAGNSNANAANYSPASEPSACTVGATDSADAKASFSNYGALVDIFAPGVQILSTWNNGGTNTISGTSMASPHIAGLGAYLLAFESLSTSALCARIIELSSKSLITGLPSGTANQLAWNGAPES